MDYAIGYLVSIFVLQAIAAIRTPREDFQVVFIASLFWPLFVVLIAGSFLLDAIGWQFDAVKGAKLFGYRKPTNPAATGFAVTVFKIELQFFKVR